MSTNYYTTKNYIILILTLILGCGILFELTQIKGVIIVILFNYLEILHLVSLFPIYPINQSLKTIECEQEKVIEEKDAFQSFFKDIVDITPEYTTQFIKAKPKIISENNDVNSERIIKCYKANVMTVSHYPEDYDEPVEKHMAAELSPEIVSILVSDANISKIYLSTLRFQTKNAIERRRKFLDIIELEKNSLQRVLREIKDIESSLTHHKRYGQYETQSDYRLTFKELSDLKFKYSLIIEKRQQDIQATSRRFNNNSEHFVQQYFYQSIRTDFPVLTNCLNSIQEINDLQCNDLLFSDGDNLVVSEISN